MKARTSVRICLTTAVLIAAPEPSCAFLTPGRSARVRFCASTNLALPFSLWPPVAGAPSLSKGVGCLNVPAQRTLRESISELRSRGREMSDQ